MKLLGIDYGRAKIGIAFSEGFLPSPVTVIPVRTKKQVMSEIELLCNKLAVEKIVIGLSGGILDKNAKAFGNDLIQQLGIPVSFVDETLSSREAIAKMVAGKTTQKKRRVMEDAVAATIILNTYLESQN